MYRQGVLQILDTGKVHLVNPTDKWGGFLSLQQQVISLGEREYDNCDYVPLHIKADVFYEIRDPQKAITRISGSAQDIARYVEECALATLGSIIRGTSLADIATSMQHSFAPEKEASGTPAGSEAAPRPPPTAPDFQASVHDQFMAALANHMYEDFGVQMNNIRIESLALQDKKMRLQLSEQAATSVQNNSALKNMENRRRLQQAEIELLTSKQAGEIRAQKGAERVEVELESENKLCRAENNAKVVGIEAAAEAKALEIRVETEARNLERLGRAKAEAAALAIKLKGEAEAESAQLLEKTTLGPKLALANVQATAVQGIQKMLYLPNTELPNLLTTLNVMKAAQE